MGPFQTHCLQGDSESDDGHISTGPVPSRYNLQHQLIRQHQQLANVVADGYS